MGCFLWIQIVIDILLQSLQCCMQYHVVLGRVITALDCIWNVWLPTTGSIHGANVFAISGCEILPFNINSRGHMTAVNVALCNVINTCMYTNVSILRIQSVHLRYINSPVHHIECPFNRIFYVKDSCDWDSRFVSLSLCLGFISFWSKL